ncbi:uncharacterized protein TRIADDRAFT_56539 [Trichoplax adhaerens]|uniref:Cytochrome b5 reductase 4 n=1 Tax=Trichoplax adhaerens TaxID=10228 RepID=B3RYF4_TRIAD|nr:hypothetical protein TRIADDRAFT_56539 [Trichoplax adhaerens]EDV25029.1 hypothetical protein TRIADDRAFT_56539 [Trichoplax adhaerens]|eukprot:XP_002112919.1 hypothetical protein TRIADDRAFT_56539 [Trichoplax adhaerens]
MGNACGNSQLTVSTSDNKQKEEEEMSNPKGGQLFPMANSPQRSSAGSTANGGRKKVILGKGYGLLDWITLGTKHPDLAGTGGIIRKITNDELARHNTETDAWTCIRGKVYNITPYMKFHPGGIDELMRSVGCDGTDLFDEIHRWVNVESMLAKCLVGYIIADGVDGKEKNKKSNGSMVSKSSLSVPTQSKEIFAVPQNIKKSPPIPRYDWYQSDKSITIVVYTKHKGLTNEDILVNVKNNRKTDIWIVLGDKILQLCLDLFEEICESEVKISTEGNIEVILLKQEIGKKWLSLGKELSGHHKLLPKNNRETSYFDCKLISKTPVTHDTWIFGVALPRGSFMHVPVGRHLIIQTEMSGMEIGRNYTPVVSLNPDEAVNISGNGRDISFMIKVYKDGALTPFLGSLKISETIKISEHLGNFKFSRLESIEQLILIAGGTGFTPMVKLMRQVKLLFGNKTEKDILWKDSLENLVRYSHDRFQVYHTLSAPSPDWKGNNGRITKEVLHKQLPPPPGVTDLDKLLICVCGPTPFTNSMETALQELGYPSETIHLFT